MKKFLETNENEHTTVQNLWGIAKAVLRGNFIAIQVFLYWNGSTRWSGAKGENRDNCNSVMNKIYFKIK